jgi:hypothetical protein
MGAWTSCNPKGLSSSVIVIELILPEQDKGVFFHIISHPLLITLSPQDADRATLNRDNTNCYWEERSDYQKASAHFPDSSVWEGMLLDVGRCQDMRNLPRYGVCLFVIQSANQKQLLSRSAYKRAISDELVTQLAISIVMLSELATFWNRIMAQCIGMSGQTNDKTSNTTKTQ